MSHYENLEIIAEETGLTTSGIEFILQEEGYQEVTDDLVEDLTALVLEVTK